MSGKYSSQDTLLLRLVMRAIDQAELTHEINNACASISANLTYIGLQSRNLVSSPADPRTIKETFEEFEEICQETGEAIQRVTRSLGKPKTEATDEHSKIELEAVVLRSTACFSDYLPAYKFNAKTEKLMVTASYRALVYCFTMLMMSCTDARAASKNPEKKCIDLELSQTENETAQLIIIPHLSSDEIQGVEETLSSLTEIASGANFKIEFINSSDEVNVAFYFSH